jgi:hypothetical protein
MVPCRFSLDLPLFGLIHSSQVALGVLVTSSFTQYCFLSLGSKTKCKKYLGHNYNFLNHSKRLRNHEDMGPEVGVINLKKKIPSNTW